jgi:hypothetical protein
VSAGALHERIAAMREEILVVAPAGDREPPGAELFDGVVRLLGGRRGGIEELEVRLHEGLARRLAWGEPERAILADAATIAQRLLGRAAGLGPIEAAELAVAVGEAGGAIARILTLAALGRVARDRAAHLREELAQDRLNAALDRQRAELDELEAELASREPPTTTT